MMEYWNTVTQYSNEIETIASKLDFYQQDIIKNPQVSDIILYLSD